MSFHQTNQKGASSDFKQATQIAQEMVCRYGMSDKVGHISLSRDEISEQSPETRALIENEIKTLLEGSYQRAKQILTDNRNELDFLAKGLLDYETLNLEEIQMVIRGENMKEYMENRTKTEEELQRQDLQFYGNGTSQKIYILEDDDDDDDDVDEDDH